MVTEDWNQEDASNHVQDMLALQEQLQLQTLRNNQNVWVIKPTFHLLQELVPFAPGPHGAARRSAQADTTQRMH